MAKYVLLSLLDVFLYAVIALTLILGGAFFIIFNAMITLEGMIEVRRSRLKEQLGIAWRKRRVKT